MDCRRRRGRLLPQAQPLAPRWKSANVSAPTVFAWPVFQEDRLQPPPHQGVDDQCSYGDMTESHQRTPRHTEVCAGGRKTEGTWVLDQMPGNTISLLKKQNYVRFLDLASEKSLTD